MPLVKNKSYYVSVSSAVLRASASTKSSARNHLLFGDWLKYLGEEKSGWAKVHCRGDDGWLRKSWFTDQRVLEVNFVDIGQGDGCHIVTPEDEIMLIDAGEGDNMFRFLSWRYNLRDRGEPETQPPLDIHHVVISHPDKDHYYGFRELFACNKVKVLNISHNGIVERPISSADKDPDLKYYSGEDLGGYIQTEEDHFFLWDVISSSEQMHSLIKKHPSTKKQYLKTLRMGVENNKNVKFTALSIDDAYIKGFGENNTLRFKVLGPVTEEIDRNNTSKKCLLRLGNEGITKNGHSVILQLQIGKLKVMLGGDLNTEAEDYLLQHYCQTELSASDLESRIYALQGQGEDISQDEKQELAEKQLELETLVTKARRFFQADIVKACHHGSHHFSETFLKALNSIATVISSGDEESYAHPRPDALGAFGKYSRGIRPLIFSTELARSTREFAYVYNYYNQLKEYERMIAEAGNEKDRNKIEKEMQGKKDRNVAVYGMITLRTDGEKVVLAQKLEAPAGNDNKWDIHELRFNQHTNEFEYNL